MIQPPLFRDVQWVRNDTEESLQIVVEPWGQPVELLAKSVFRFEAESSKEGRLEFCKADWGVAVFAWPGATLNLYGGDVLVADFPNAVPDIPDGLTMRGFLGLLFGATGEGGK